ncbi:MAG: sodium:proton antiporter [Candidatus Riflebacteria bacterium]|nr:sodium:proton antiporter [Candidatus Riflebacteria bacterium]
MPTQATIIPVHAIIPFVCLLLSIALFPLFVPKLWEQNSKKAMITLFFSLPILVYYWQNNMEIELFRTFEDYLSFIALLASLYVASGGVLLKGDFQGTPINNVAILGLGSLLANFIGTTGASMVLIRPLVKINSQRNHTAHIPIFFIFLVSNIGGCLTPLGDPPLFLGYLQGVPFFWTLRLFWIWLFCISILLSIFFLFDTIQYKKESEKALFDDRSQIEPVKICGKRNFIFLGGIISSAFLLSPWREILMISMAIFSYLFTVQENRLQNHFSFSPINEVAILFAGIFITMVPALRLLKENGTAFGITEPWQFFWVTGGLSAFLDNAPTYLTGISLAQGLNLNLPSSGGIIGVPHQFLLAISAGAVFMGALTYIGNGPNFMVKTIAEESGIKMPSFFGYMLYSGLILIPLFVLVTIVFLRL